MMGMRIPYAMGVQNKLPFSKQFAYLHPKYATPVVSGIFLLAVTSIMIISGSYNSLTDMCMFVIWIFYTIAFYGVIKLRRDEPDLKRPYKTPLYPLIPILAILGGLFVVIITVFTQPVNALIGVGLTLLGLPIYLSRKDKFKDLSHLDDGGPQDHQHFSRAWICKAGKRNRKIFSHIPSACDGQLCAGKKQCSSFGAPLFEAAFRGL